MRILQVINSLISGGAEKLLLETLPLYKEKGIDMDVMVFEGVKGGIQKQLLELDCCVINSLNTKPYNPFIIFKIIPFLRKYDIIHVHLFPALYWVLLAKILSFSKVKVVFTEHSTFNRRRRYLLFKYFDKLIYKKYNKVICISSGVKQQLDLFLDFSLKNMFVIENGIKINKFKNAYPLNKHEINDSILENDKLLVQVSVFRPEKDQITVIKSMMHLPFHFKLLLVGDGPLREKCQLLVDQLCLNNRVFFLGNRNDVERIFKTADLSILSSHWEGFGLVAVEGMASGKPVIASNLPGISDIVSDAGLLFDHGDDLGLAKIVFNILSDENKELYDKISINCLNRANQFDITRMVIEIFDMYNNLMKN